MDVFGAEGLAAELLGVPSVAALAQRQVARALLPNGRVEAHEYGLRQHSSASAGAVLVGLSGSCGVPDAVVAPLVAVVHDLVDEEGRVRSHDGDPESGDNVWSQSQRLLGLLQRPHLVWWSSKLTALVKRVARTFASGGFVRWPIHDPDVPAVMHTSADAYINSRGTTINHFP